MNLLKQLELYKQTHLLKHHKSLVENKQNELELLESFSKIDFATMDFVLSNNPAFLPSFQRGKTGHRHKGIQARGYQTSD